MQNTSSTDTATAEQVAQKAEETAAIMAAIGTPQNEAERSCTTIAIQMLEGIGFDHISVIGWVAPTAFCLRKEGSDKRGDALLFVRRGSEQADTVTLCQKIAATGGKPQTVILQDEEGNIAGSATALVLPSAKGYLVHVLA